MDRAEAIERIERWKDTADKYVENFERTFPTMRSSWRGDSETFDMAITALREQEQRELGCEYCDGTETDLYYQDGACHQMNDRVYIAGNRVECDFGCKAWGAFEIRFCPMCGRKLKEGAEG